MNVFKNLYALSAIYRAIRVYLRNAAAIDAAAAAGDHEAARQIMREHEGVFCDTITRELGLTVEVIGRENIPEKGPFLVVANHQSYADVFALIAAFHHTPVGFIAKAEFRRLKPLARAIEHTGSLFITREDPRAAIQALREATEKFRQGYSLAIFPEGKRSHRQEMAAFKAGSFKFAQKAGVPIVPVTLIDAYRVYEESGSFHAGNIKVVIHPVYHYEQLDRRAQAAAHSTVEAIVRQGLSDYAAP